MAPNKDLIRILKDSLGNINLFAIDKTTGETVNIELLSNPLGEVLVTFDPVPVEDWGVHCDDRVVAELPEEEGKKVISALFGLLDRMIIE